MITRNRKAVLTLAICLIIAVASMFTANLIQTGFGDIDVVTASFEVDNGADSYDITYKLYIPKEASESNPLPALLCLHGYQNDYETSAAYAIEAARRGIVAVCIDEFGHGYNGRSMKNRGWTTYKVQGVSADGTETTVKTKLKGPDRFLTMMNFSTLSFFEGSAYSVNEEKTVSFDADKDGVWDSSMGGIAAYNWLKTLPYVQSDNIAITGHSMGTWASWSVAAACPDHKAVILQCGEVFGDNMFDSSSVEFHNVLMLQARYDEFNYFRDYRQETVNDKMLESGIREQFFTAYGRTAPQASYTWNTTYGSFADGTARRVELIETNHRLTTHNSHAVAAAMDWLESTLGVQSGMPSDKQVFMIKELFVMVAMLAVMVALCPLFILITNIGFFRVLIIDRRSAGRAPKLMSRGQWWKNAWIAVLIGAVTYPFMTQLGHGLLPVPENIFRMTVGNGFMTWYLTLAIISIIMVIVSRASNKKRGIDNLDYYDMGLSRPDKARRLDWALLIKSFIASTVTVACMYGLVCLFKLAFKLDLRFIWPFFKTFTKERFIQFLVYLLPFMLFFIVNVGFKLFGNMRQIQEDSVGNFIKCWFGNVFVLLGGLLIVTLLEYIPFFMGYGPGADLCFGTTFGGPFMSALILLIPQFIFFTYLSTWFERKCGNVYVGAFISAMLASWIVTGGSAMF
jgi:dienelactone hydrolase